MASAVAAVPAWTGSCVDVCHGRGGEKVIHISVSATGVPLAECPLVVVLGLVPFSGGDSLLTVGLSRGSCGRGATDTNVLAWFSSSTWKDSA